MPAFKYLCVSLCFSLFIGLISNGQTLTLYSFPPPHPYKWRSPHSLLISTVRNYYSKSKKVPRRILGHMVIELRKDTAVFLTGMVSDEISGMKNLLFKEKIGLGVLFRLVKGHMEKTKLVESELQMRTELGKAVFITFKLNDSAYNYLLSFVDSFKLKGYDTLYNGFNLPRSGKGGGCTAFGISFLELINALPAEYCDSWAVHVNIPEKLIGDTANQRKVTIWRLLRSFRWAKKNEPSRKFVLFEPSLIYRWINRVWSNGQNKTDTKYECIQIGHAKGLVVDCSQNTTVSPMFTR